MATTSLPLSRVTASKRSAFANLLRGIERQTFMRWRFIPNTGIGPFSWCEEWLRGLLRDPAQFMQARTPRECTCCGFVGLFVSHSRGGAREARCPWCKSRTRDRLLALVLRQMDIDLHGKRVLHFAPEWPLFNQLKHSPGYVGGDIIQRRNATAVVDMRCIDYAAESFDVLIANHVLEHIGAEDAALRECFRALVPGGVAFLSVPLDVNRYTTWNPKSGMTTSEIEAICGRDHVRLYGWDFMDRLRAAGFDAVARRVLRSEAERYRILENDVLFICTKPGER